MSGTDQPDDDIWRPKEERDRVKGLIHRALRARPTLTCLYPQSGGCPEPVIDSHSVQKSPILRPLADVGNHVIMLQADLSLGEPPFNEPPKPKAKRVGVNLATTFRGLCASHDSSLFEPIEDTSFDPTCDRHIFLAAYRSVLMELHRKRVSQAQLRAIAEGICDDQGAHPDARQVAVSAALAYAKGDGWITDLKERFDQAITAQDYSRGLIHWGTTLSTPTSFAVSSCFTPSFDFVGNQVQRFRPDREPNWISLSVFPRDGQTDIALTIPTNSPSQIANIRSALRVATPDEFQLRLSELTLANAENIAIAPDWWNALDETRQNAIQDYFAATVLGGESPFPGTAASLFS